MTLFYTVLKIYILAFKSKETTYFLFTQYQIEKKKAILKISIY